MFIGHYGLGYAVKKADDKIPLWVLFVSVQLLDIIAFTLVLLGIEHASFAPSNNPFFRNQLDLPYSHSLSGAILISLAVFLLFWATNRKRWAWILGLCVFSHWFIDLIVHTNDLSLWFGSYNVGLGLWKYPYVSYSLEVLLVLLTWPLIKRKNLFSHLLLFLMIASFTGMTFSEEPEIMKHNDALRTSVVLISNGLFIFLAFLSDGRKRRRT
jgi:hypothetical protein